MIEIVKKPEGKLLLILVLVAIFMGYKTVRLPKKSSVNVTILQNKRPIATVYDAKMVSKTKQIEVPTIDFTQGGVLHHNSMGPLDFKHNFFMNLDTKMDVKEGGYYRFIVTSDDGFVLKIDNKKVCEFSKNRAFEPTVCSSHLNKGEHIFKLSYFQGGGPLGLKVEYLKGSKRYLVGESSGLMRFEVLK